MMREIIIIRYKEAETSQHSVVMEPMTCVLFKVWQSLWGFLPGTSKQSGYCWLWHAGLCNPPRTCFPDHHWHTTKLIMPPSRSLFLTVWSETCTPVACWRLYIELWQWSPCSSSNQGAHTGPAARLMPFYDPVQLSSCNIWSPGMSSMLLRLCWGRQKSLLWLHILGELDNLCNLIGLQVPSHTTSSDKNTSRTKTREESVRKDQERAIVWGHHMQKHSLFRVVLLLSLHCTCCHFDLQQSRWN